jgi:hypothetical protein
MPQEPADARSIRRTLLVVGRKDEVCLFRSRTGARPPVLLWRERAHRDVSRAVRDALGARAYDEVVVVAGGPSMERLARAVEPQAGGLVSRRVECADARIDVADLLKDLRIGG